MNEEEGTTTAVDKLSSSEELYFTKDGRLKPGKAPTAFAWTNPWPPLPTNLNKNKVFRPTEEQNEEVVKVAKEEFEKESKPLIFPEDINALERMPVPDIELALYWDRHPYEFRPSGGKQRSKSAQNLSSIGDLLHTKAMSPCPGSHNSSSADSFKNNTKRASSANPQIRRNSSGSSVSSISIGTSNYKDDVKCDNPMIQSSSSSNGNGDRKNHQNLREPSGNPGTKSPPERSHRKSSKSHGANNSHLPEILQVLSTNEKRKLEDINNRSSQSTHPNHYGRNNHNSVKQEESKRPVAVRNVNKSNSNNNGNSIGVQASIDDITSAALMSTYLCPLHGQYHRGIERRNKNGFRTDMSSTMNPHARCSRSRTRLVKDTEIQTEETGNDNHALSSNSTSANKKESYSNKSRSKTAIPRSRTRSNNNNMLSEYNGNYKNPAKVKIVC